MPLIHPAKKNFWYVSLTHPSSVLNRTLAFEKKTFTVLGKAFHVKRDRWVPTQGQSLGWHIYSNEIWPKSSFSQNEWKSCDGYPLWLDVAGLPEVPMARALHSDGSRFLNFCKTPLQAWEMSVWTKTSNFHQNWRNSTDGCPLWTAIARLPEVQLTWILFLWLANAQLMIWGF